MMYEPSDVDPDIPVESRTVPKEVWPTQKPHVSFSELSDWRECAFRHMLIHIEKKGKVEETPHTIFGNAVHDGNEQYLKTREIDKQLVFDLIREGWERNPEFVTGPWPSWAFDSKKNPGFGKVEDWIEKADRILNDVPAFLEKEFPEWKYFAAEELLYEKIDDKPISFKGYIDGVLKVKNKKGKELYWLIDWKTCGWGWSLDVKRSFDKQLQLILYKYYWSQKHGVPYKDIRCGFVLMKRDGKPGRTLELVPVSVGPTTTARGLKVINNYTAAVQRGLFLKNRSACDFCQFKNTPDCP